MTLDIEVKEEIKEGGNGKDPSKCINRIGIERGINFIPPTERCRECNGIPENGCPYYVPQASIWRHDLADIYEVFQNVRICLSRKKKEKKA